MFIIKIPKSIPLLNKSRLSNYVIFAPVADAIETKYWVLVSVENPFN